MTPTLRRDPVTPAESTEAQWRRRRRCTPTATRHTFTRVGVVFVAMAGLLGGCGLFGRDNPTVGAAKDPVSKPTIVVIDPGSSPRRPLRLALERGTTIELDLSFDLYVSQRSVDPPSDQDIDPPPTIQSIRITVIDVDETGAVLGFEVTDVRIDPDGTALTDVQILQLTASLQELIGLEGTLRVDRVGDVVSSRYEVPASVSTEATEAIESFEDQLAGVIPPLPIEPVGRGARWRHVATRSTSGLAVRQTTTYELTSIDGPDILYRASITQDATEQPLASGDDESDAHSPRLLAADLAGTSSGSFSLTELTSSSETQIRGSQLIEQTVPAGRPKQYEQELDLTVTVTPRGQ